MRQMLWPINAQRVLEISLSLHDMSDFIAWSYTKNEMFTVRSAYFAEWDYQHGSKLRHANGTRQIDVNHV